MGMPKEYQMENLGLNNDNAFDAEVTITFVINNVCLNSDLDEYTSFEDIVRELIEDEGLSIADEFIIEKIRKI